MLPKDTTSYPVHRGAAIVIGQNIQWATALITTQSAHVSVLFGFGALLINNQLGILGGRNALAMKRFVNTQVGITSLDIFHCFHMTSQWDI
jgi:hypothetical protein